jgi:DNA sulfur modification protein DndD
MKLIELTLNNFKIFKGMQTLKFPTDPAQNLMFVLRTYGLGKTTLIVAIRWVYFGKGKRIPEEDFNTQINVPVHRLHPSRPTTT